MSDQILDAVLDLKSDVGGVKADIQGLRTALAEHVSSSATAHARITALEMHNAQVRGMTTVWGAIAVAIGTVAGYVVEFIVHRFGGHP